MTSERYQYFKDQRDREFNIDSMKKYVGQKTEIDRRLEELLRPYLSSGNPRVLDACCGLGHLSCALAEAYPDASFLGVDQTSYLIDEAKRLCAGNPNVAFDVGDVEDLPKKYPAHFDVTISRQ